MVAAVVTEKRRQNIFIPAQELSFSRKNRPEWFVLSVPPMHTHGKQHWHLPEMAEWLIETSLPYQNVREL